MTTPIRPGSSVVPSAAAAPARTPVRPQDIPRTPWNFFVYLNADNNLESFGKADLNEMERVGSMPGRMNVFALVDGSKGYTPDGGGWDSTTKLMWVQKDPSGSANIVSREIAVDAKSELGKLLAAGKGELNLGDPKVMNAALKYVQQNIPSEHLFVDMWDHGDSWHAASIDDSGTAMEPSRGHLQQALAGVKVDVLGFDECLMSAREIAQAAKGAGAQQMVGSEFLEPGTGWNYEDLFKRFNKLFDDKNVSAQSLARTVVDSYVSGGKDNSHLAATDLSRMDAIESRTGALSDALIRAGGLSSKTIRNIYQQAQRDDDSGEQMDLGDFARRLAASTALPPDVRNTAQELAKEIATASYSRTAKGATQAANTTGLTTYAPLQRFDSEYVKTPSNPWVGSKWTDFIDDIDKAPAFRSLVAAPRPPHPAHHKGGASAGEWFLQ